MTKPDETVTESDRRMTSPLEAVPKAGAHAGEPAAKLRLKGTTAWELEAKAEAREAELGAERAEAEVLRERVASLEMELTKVYASTSWRITGSLRGVSRGLSWLLRNAHRLLVLAWWLGTGQFGRAARALLLLYGRYVPLSVKERIPQRVREEVRRRLAQTANFEWIGRDQILSGWDRSLIRRRAASPEKVPIEHAKALYLRRCELSVFRLRTRGAIAFPREGRPYVSVIICAYNKFPYNIRVLELLEHAASYAKAKIGVGIEVVFIDDGSSDETVKLENYVEGIVFRHVSANGGFLRACNLGASLAAGTYLVFLNNDVEFEADVFVRLYEAVERDKAEVACFGGAILQFDGSIQDLGSGVWRDGVAQGHFRDALPTRYAFAYPRDVDYVGGCFFCISRADFRDLGGFDELYSPGYYEETDLCLRLRKSGKRARVYPDIRIYHLEFGTFSSDKTPCAATSLMARNRVLFARQHQDLLVDRPAYAANAGYPVCHKGVRPRLLFIEDQLPSLRLGSGFGRSEIMIRALLEAADIEIFACLCDNAHLAPDDFRYIEVTYGPDPALLKRLLSSRHFDAVYVCRPHNLARYERTLRGWKAGGGKIVFDTEAIYAVRETARLESAESYAAITASARFWTLVEEEFRPAGLADIFVVVNEFESAILRERFARPVHTIGHHLAARPLEPGPGARSGLFFVGALPGTRAPNYDSLLWFLDCVWPRIRAARPEERLRIAGFVGPTVSLDALRRPGVTCLGSMADLSGEYARARAFIAPTRFAAGLPFKVHEAMSYGLPVICSRLLYEQLAAPGKFDGAALAATVNDEGQEFAEACLKLLADDALWLQQREKGLAYIAQHCAPGALRDVIGALLRELDTGFLPPDRSGLALEGDGHRRHGAIVDGPHLGSGDGEGVGRRKPSKTEARVETVHIDDLVEPSALDDALKTWRSYVRLKTGQTSRRARNALIINGRGREGLLQSEHTEVRAVRDLGLYFLPEAVIKGHCFVWHQERYILDGSEPTPGLQLANNLGFLSPGRKRLSEIELTQPALIIAAPGHYVWGHWLLDFLPRLALAQSALGRDLEGAIIPLPTDTPQWALNLISFFCGIARQQVIMYDWTTESMHCRAGICMPTYAHSNYFFHSYIKELYARFIPEARSGASRICVSRRAFAGHSRSVARTFKQQDYWEDVARRKGYMLVSPERLDFHTQIGLFASAKVVVGEYGSGMHNAIFSQPGTIVGQFAVPNTIQSRISGLCGHRSVFLLPDADPDFSGPSPVALAVSEAAIDEFFDAVEGIVAEEADD